MAGSEYYDREVDWNCPACGRHSDWREDCGCEGYRKLEQKRQRFMYTPSKLKEQLDSIPEEYLDSVGIYYQTKYGKVLLK